LQALFVNENIGGNATMHVHLRNALQAGHPDVSAEFLDVPQRSLVRRGVGVAVPGLARLDLDLAPLRGQLALSAHVRRRLLRWPRPFDVLHVYTHNAALLSVDILRAHPAVVGLDATSAQSLQLLPYRTPTRFTAPAARPGQRLEQRVYDAADAIVVKSDWARQSLLGDYRVDAARVRLIPYGIELPDAPDVQRQDDLIVFVGRSMTRKGGWLLLEAWRRHLRDHARLLLITPEAVAEEPGLTVVSDVRPGDGRLHPLLASAAVLAFPSTGDTFGYAALEAMALGTPVVAARSAAIPEIITHAETGVLVDPADAEALAAGLTGLLADATARRRMGAAARAEVERRFDARRTTADVVTLLREVADR
jgi:glycosyltransferase involved in cell wall biosynthesis